MELGLSSKVALVTGSTRGIGKAIALRLTEEGCRVVTNGRHLESGEESQTQNALGVAADVTQPEDCQGLVARTIEAFGRLDVLVCCVGSGASVSPGQETAAEWRRGFDVNFFCPTNIVEAAGPAIRRSQGTILCISSIAGSMALGAPATYSSAKAALNMFVRTIARPFGCDNVNVNGLAPGNILFEGSVWDRKLREDRGAVEALLEREVPLRRLGTPEEIANIAAFLVSPRASFMTGEIVVADGGQVRG